MRKSSQILPAAVAALVLALPCAADEPEPEPDFVLEDLNPASARFGDMISPRQYGEWISVYYFGQETWSHCQAQFGALQIVTEELAGGTDLPVQVIGLSRSAYQASNNSGSLAAMTVGRTMPWLRCVNPEASNDPSTTWRIPVPPTGDRAINNRELVILDQRNRFLGSFDLTAGPINDEQPGGAARRAIVRDFIKAAATIVDSDNDGLPDYWERDSFTDLSAEADMTMPERGGRSVFAEYALGPWPPELTLEVPVGGGAPVRTLRYRRRLGIADGLIYDVATAEGLTAWGPFVAGEVSVEATRPVYDGSGMGEVVVRWILPGEPEGQLFRVTATAP